MRKQMCIAFAGLLLLNADSGFCLAADAPQPLQPLNPGSGLTVVDWMIIVLYGASTLALGWYFGRRQRNINEYFVGSGHMNPVLVGVSLFATLLSTISYLSMPGEALGKGPGYQITNLALPFVFLVVGFGLIPVYMRQRVTSAYELLEDRLGLSVRLLGASLFIALRLAWMSLLVFLTAKAMTIMLGVTEDAIPWIVLVTGLVAVTYTSLGGLRAVVITDCLQTVLLFSGALLVVGTVTFDLGGFGWFPTTWQDNWDIQPLYSTDPSTRLTLIGSMVSVFIWYVCTSGGDQTSVQRFMATKDASAARWAYATQLTVGVVVGLTLACVGFALLGYFEAHPELLPAHINLKNNADDVFPFFIAYRLPMGISGLVVSAMFAAAMSSLDSGVNSITAVVMTDFRNRLGRTPLNDRQQVLLAKCLCFGIGALVVIGSSQMYRVPGNITEMTQKTSNLLTTPIFCLFFFALFVPFARPIGVFAGTICGVGTAAVIAFSGPLFGFVGPDKNLDPISFQYIGPCSILVDLAVGCLVSLGDRKLRPQHKKLILPQ